jgi:hypothetical protein
MLDTLDILIGFTLIMLIVSLPVTLLTAGVSDALNLRGRALHKGVVSLLGLLSRGTGVDVGSEKQAIATALLTDELVAKRGLLGRLRLAGTVHRDELTKLIIAFGSLSAGQADARAKLMNDLVAKLGITDPAATLKAVRFTQMELERLRPDLANDVRASQALLTHAAQDLVARMNSWFDQQMDRVEELFILYVRIATGAVALSVALLLQLDAIALVNRLADDKTVRNALVEMAVADPARFDPAPEGLVSRAEAEVSAAQAALKELGTGADRSDAEERLKTAHDALASLKARQQARAQLADASRAVVEAEAAARAAPEDPELATALANARERQEAARDTLSDLAATADDFARSLTANPDIDTLVGFNLVRVPKTAAEWWASLTAEGAFGRILGILIGAGLLSMGGPFWYGLLQNLIKLRSSLTRKEQEQREIRQTSQPPAASPAAVRDVAAPVGTQGASGEEGVG